MLSAELRDRLGKVVTAMAESGALPPAYFDERAGLETITRLDTKLAGRSAEEVVAAETWLRQINASGESSVDVG